jgi:LmbE family N-acetylglucosaminyl deacetylase
VEAVVHAGTAQYPTSCRRSRVVAVSKTRDAGSSGVLFLSPHNDDETLFGAFTLLRERPRVVTVLRSYVQEQRGTGVTYQEREAENAAALEVLGIGEWEQWPFPDSDPPWNEIRERLASLRPDHVFAPAIERGGHAHHSAIGGLAEALWPGKVTPYTTYTTRGRTRRGTEVAWEHEWVLLKLKALSCYRSQILVPGTLTTQHFLGSQAEYYAGNAGPIAGAAYWAVDTAHLLLSALGGAAARTGFGRSSAEP